MKEIPLPTDAIRGAVQSVDRFAGVLLSTFLLAGCATNPIAKSYRDRPAGVDSAGLATRFVPYSGTTRLQASTDLGGDGVNLGQEGYIMVGTSVYEGRDPITAAQILAQGQKVRADLVLYQSGMGIPRAAVPITDNAESPRMPHQSGVPNPGIHGYGTATVTATHRQDALPDRTGTISTSMVPTVRLPVHSATFWRKRMTTPKS